MASEKVQFQLQFVIPSESALSIARRLLESSDQDQRDVSKAVIDITDAALKLQRDISQAGDLDIVDMAPYLDIWLGGAVESAQKLLVSQEKEIRQIAECLLSQEKAISQSKEIVLKELKRIQHPLGGGN